MTLSHLTLMTTWPDRYRLPQVKGLAGKRVTPDFLGAKAILFLGNIMGEPGPRMAECKSRLHYSAS